MEACFGACVGGAALSRPCYGPRSRERRWSYLRKSEGRVLLTVDGSAEEFSLENGETGVKYEDEGKEIVRKSRGPRKFESIADLPRLAAEMESIDDVVPPLTDAESSARSGNIPPPRVEGYRHSQSTPNIDWRYWQNAGPRVDGTHCPGCGQKFQTEDDTKLGFVPGRKLEEHSGGEGQNRPPPLCARCHSLRYKSTVDDSLTVQGALSQGLPHEELLPQSSEDILKKLRGIKCVVVYLIDVIDFSGTCLELTRLVGTRNPVIVGANKCDLLPTGFSTTRLKKWMKTESKRAGLDKCYDIHILNSLKGQGVKTLLDQAYVLAKRGKCDIYVVGAANVGKSSFINSLLISGWKFSKKPTDKPNLLATTSHVPGTTLSLIPIATGDGLTIYDTPGVVLPRNITTYLKPSEVKRVLPSGKIESFGARFEAEKSLLFGGLARIDAVEGRTCLASWFCSSSVTVHLRKTDGVLEYIEKSVGDALQPPNTADDYEGRWEWDEVELEIEGDSWREAAEDVVIAGLGWASITVNGRVKLRVVAPKGVGVYTRPPLLPYEAVYGTAKYLGNKWTNKYKEEFLKRERRIQQSKPARGKSKDAGPFPDYENRRIKNFKGFSQ